MRNEERFGVSPNWESNPNEDKMDISKIKDDDDDDDDDDDEKSYTSGFSLVYCEQYHFLRE